MTDYVAGHITVGGQVPKRLVKKLCQRISSQEVALNWADWDFHPKSASELLKARKKIAGHHVLRLYSDNVANGNFDLLQDFLQEHELPFNRWHEAKYETQCELMVYRPGADLRFFQTNFLEEIVVRARPLMLVGATIQEVQQQLRGGSERKAQRLLRQCAKHLAENLPSGFGPVPSFEIV